MIIQFQLDKRAVTIDADYYTPFTTVLARLASLPHTIGTAPCDRSNHSGACGSCMVLYNTQPTRACLLAAYRAHESEILTIATVRNSPEYAIIRRGFDYADMNTCGYCQPARALLAYAALHNNAQPSKAILHDYARAIRCSCTSINQFEQALSEAANLQRKRGHVRAYR